MTVNVISDIHASINKKNGRVVYDIKSRFSKNRIEKAFNILYETFYNVLTLYSFMIKKSRR